MKINLYASFYLVAFSILCIDSRTVKAIELKCNSDKPISALLQQDGGKIFPTSGATILAEKRINGIDGGYISIDEVKNVVVIGQDPEEEGVSFTVTVESVPGKIQHDEWFDHQVERCVARSPSEPRPDNVKSCYPYSSVNPPLVYYLETVTEKECRRIETPARRMIKSIRVWLEPSYETSAWLGWGTMVYGGRASLRYMFPDKWMAGTWTPEGFTTTGTPDNTWNDEYFERWLSQLEDTNFLAGEDARIQNLWSVTLPEVGHPETGDTVLGLLGSFDRGNVPIITAPIDGYTINYTDINANTSKHRAAFYPSSLNSMSLSTEKIVIQFVHVPLDLPGIWKIGIQIKMERASADSPYSGVQEYAELDDWDAANTKWIKIADTDYSPNANYFFSYVLVSTPCNPLEEKGCWDGSY